MTLNDDQIQQIIANFTQNLELQQVVAALQAQVATNADGTTDYATTLQTLSTITPADLLPQVANPPKV